MVEKFGHHHEHLKQTVEFRGRVVMNCFEVTWKPAGIKTIGMWPKLGHVTGQ